MWNHEDASWRNMLVVQPPCTKLEVIRRTHPQMGDFESLVLERPEGLRMGLLYDVIEQWSEETSNPFAIQYSILDDDQVPEPPLVTKREIEYMNKENWDDQRRECVLKNQRRYREDRRQYRPKHVVRNAVPVVLHSTASCMHSDFEGPRMPWLAPEWRSARKENFEIVIGNRGI